MSALKILVGCDPEVFVTDSITGQFVSAHGLIPGTKSKPYSVPNGAVQVDGNALEFNIDPAANQEQFIGNVSSVLDRMRSMVPGYNVVIEPVALFEQGYWDSIPEAAKELGCEPDFNAYTQEPNERPTLNLPMSVAGGHVHIGWTSGVDTRDRNHFLDCCEVAKQLDYYLGAWSLTWDPDTKRRSLYGKAGSFRPKPYGCEYRTLSNAWLRSPELIAFVYYAAYIGVAELHEGRVSDRINPSLARNVIQSNDADFVRNRWSRYARVRPPHWH